jgi:DNA-directed RNA polymerase subunit M/transcription elongation factor TFIIS
MTSSSSKFKRPSPITEDDIDDNNLKLLLEYFKYQSQNSDTLIKKEEINWNEYFKSVFPITLSNSQRDTLTKLFSSLSATSILESLDLIMALKNVDEAISIISTSISSNNPSLIMEKNNLLDNVRVAEKIELRALTEQIEVSEGIYKCPRCGSKKTVSRQKQLRSSDEPMSDLVSCAQCGKKWIVM